MSCSKKEKCVGCGFLIRGENHWSAKMHQEKTDWSKWKEMIAQENRLYGPKSKE